jgi:hypothetical protein
MAGQSPAYRVIVDDFTLGENLVLPPNKLPRGMGQLSWDTDPYTPVFLMPRKPFVGPVEGSTTLDTGSVTGMCDFGLAEFYRDNVGNLGRLYTVDVGSETTADPPRLMYIGLGSASPASVGAVSVPATLITDYPPQMVTFGSGGTTPYLIISMADTPMWKFDGSTLSLVSGSAPSKISFIEAHKRRMWALPSAATSMGATSAFTLSHSALNTVEDWTTSGNAGTIVIPNLGEPRTGLKSDGDILYVFYLRHIIAIYGDDPLSWYVQTVSNRIGCVSSESIVRVTGPNNVDVIMFAAEDGFYALSGMELQKVSGDLFTSDVTLLRYNTGRTVPSPWIRGMSHGDVVMWSRTQISGSAGSYSKTAESTLLCYNMKTGAWREFNVGGDAGSITSLVSSPSRTRIFALSFNKRFIEGPQMSPLTNGIPDATLGQDGDLSKANVVLKWRAPAFIPKTIDHDYQLRKIYVQSYALTGYIKIIPVVDGVTATAFTFEVGTTAPTRKVRSYPFLPQPQGREVTFQIEGDASTTSQNLCISQIDLFIDDLGEGR